MATHSSILSWEIPWTQGLVGYSPWGHRPGHDLATEQQHQQSTDGAWGPDHAFFISCPLPLPPDTFKEQCWNTSYFLIMKSKFTYEQSCLIPLSQFKSRANHSSFQQSPENCIHWSSEFYHLLFKEYWALMTWQWFHYNLRISYITCFAILSLNNQ